jgi:hypothetical protein
VLVDGEEEGALRLEALEAMSSSEFSFERS